MAQATLCSMGIQLPLEKRAQPPPIFGPCLLWPNVWMDEDATWYGNRPWPRPHCVRRRLSLHSDFALSGDLRTVENDVLAIMDAAAETGLQLNQDKCEIIMDDFTLISASTTFSQFIRTKKDEMMPVSYTHLTLPTILRV